MSSSNKIIFVVFFLFTLACSSQKQQDKIYQIGEIKTEKGDMLFWLYDETPKHKESFLQLASANYWDTLIFNRVIENFVIQGGCPDTPEGFSDSPYLIEPEFNENIKHLYGAVGAGRDENPDKLSAGCQLYIVHNKKGIPRLDGEYMIFGQIINGFEVLNSIATVETDSLDTPLVPIMMDVNVIELSEKELQKLDFEIPTN